MKTLTNIEKQILKYIRYHIKTTEFFKSKHIAKDIGLTSKEVGTSLLHMSKKKLGSIRIIKYARAISTTWKAERIKRTKRL